MIVADDMNWDTPGSFGGAAPEITPNIDHLAAEGMRFRHAYVNAKLRQWMVQVEDPALHAFDHRDKREALEEFILDYRKRAAEEVEALKPYEKKHGYRF
jgi:hypothetical protein